MSKSIHDYLLSKCTPVNSKSGDNLVEEDEEEEEDLKPSKISKIDNNLEDNLAKNKPEIDGFLLKLEELKFVRILNAGTNRKSIAVECLYLGEPAVIVLEKTQFEIETTEKLIEQFCGLFDNATNLFRNDIFGSYLLDIDPSKEGQSCTTKLGQQYLSKLNRLFVSVVHPATPRDIRKYLDQERMLITETYRLYLEVTKPYIDRLVAKPGHLQWLYNVLEHKAEVDRIFYEELSDPETGFILTKDMKWKTQNDEHLTDLERHELYLNALVIRRDLHSLRDLNSQHLPLLEAIAEHGSAAIYKRYQIDRRQLRIFIHYQPSFYHLHIHFTHIRAENGGFQCERSHMLSNVIENIRLVPDYYQKVALQFPLSELSELKVEQYDGNQ